jgi:phosphoribosylglycinamide formyltransferase-1
MSKIRLAILASGSGSNAEAIMKWAAASEIAEVVCVGCNKKAAMVLSRAEIFNIPKFTILKRKNESRESYDQRMSEALSEFKPDWIILAGYMRLLTQSFLAKFNHQVINMHPSLLPMFPGLDGYGDAFKAGVLESGCTVHYVDAGLDSGPIIEQRRFPLIPGESFEDFKKRGLAIENQFYPEVLEKLFRGKL